MPRAELRKFSRELKKVDPSAELTMEYDKLDVGYNLETRVKSHCTLTTCPVSQVNGRKYTWSDAAHAVMDMMDNSVSKGGLYHKLVETIFM